MLAHAKYSARTAFLDYIGILEYWFDEIIISLTCPVTQESVIIETAMSLSRLSVRFLEKLLLSSRLLTFK